MRYQWHRRAHSLGRHGNTKYRATGNAPAVAVRLPPAVVRQTPSSSADMVQLGVAFAHHGGIGSRLPRPWDNTGGVPWSKDSDKPPTVPMSKRVGSLALISSGVRVARGLPPAQESVHAGLQCVA